ncbi:hypothetical protein Scep_013536 [Stephania cephalantha]|uniref:CBM20 domain-containing protein n=1 Tax=Stephania cephalantha TaxID=152367 RepID=A0AAP0JH91_9MAGN
MRVCEARARPLCGGQRRCLGSSFLGNDKTLRPCICHCTPSQNTLFLQPRSRPYSLKSTVVSARKLRKASPSQEVCKVLWTIEADLEEGQLLYITGDPAPLGCWNPEMAILMSPSGNEANLWITESKVPCGTNFKYNYFIKGDKWPSSDIVWRPGPEFSVSVPQKSKQKGKLLVKDSWMTVQTERFPVHSWNSWMEDVKPTTEHAEPSTSQDEQGMFRSLESNLLLTAQFGNTVPCVDEPYHIEKDFMNNVNKEESELGQLCSERDQPVEEPWLVQSSMFFLQLKDKLDSVVSNKVPIQEDFNLVGFPDAGFISNESSKDESSPTLLEEPISTAILINSSICTMQRIAVLEDGKLVELLLEPVKNNVQCDSVYLGVVTKLVPNMGGAFVNIGLSRPSLMDIKHNREPFVFPPFRRKVKNKDADEHEEHVNMLDNRTSLRRVFEDVNGFAEAHFHGDPLKLMDEDFKEHDVDDDTDLPEILEGNMNGSIVDYGGGGADFDDYADEEEDVNHLEGEAFNNEASTCLDSQLSSHAVLSSKDAANAPNTGSKWSHIRKGTKVIVQVVKEGLGTKGPTLTAYPNLRSRFWILNTRCDKIGVSKKISGVDRTRLRVIAKTLQPPGFGLTVRTVAVGHSLQELQRDLEGLLLTWKDITEHAKSAALAADEGVEGAIPVLLHRAMGQTLSVAQDYFNDKVKSMIVDSPRTYHEVTSYLQEIAPDLCDRVELYDKRTPIFDEYGIEEEIDNMLSKRVPLGNGGSLVIEQTEALVSIDVNGGHGMLGRGNSQQKAILEVNLAAAKQIARELRLRDIGGIIVVDFIDMVDDSNKRLVYEEIKKAVERDRSLVKVSELSRHGLMEITRKRVRPSVTFMISEPCTCCHATGRVEALETSYSKIEHQIRRLLASSDQKADLENPKSWPRFILRVDHSMCVYLTSGKETRLALLCSSLKVWIILKVARGFTRGQFDVKPFSDDEESNDQHQVAISRLRITEARPNVSNKRLTIFHVKKRNATRKRS